MSSVEWVVFDLDDTLYLEREYVFSGFRAVGRRASELGIDGFGERCSALFAEGARSTIFDQALALLGGESDPQVIAGLVEVYRNHIPNIRLLPDVEGVFSALKKEGVGVALLTGGPIESQELKIKALGLARWCDPIVLSARWGPEFDKPHPRGFAKVESVTAAEGDSLVYVCDNPHKDIIPARDRGWGCVRVRRTGAIHVQIPTPDGIAEIADLNTLLAVVRAF